ncbi:hypothetical protein TWF694_007222 [Orbilia ellipsospora]|uniref:Uncharacterized protein n=1 Tax=Orbilia ellipsospora TaxID=2528407 RepID=A0AAV9XI07_9PEZI
MKAIHIIHIISIFTITQAITVCRWFRDNEAWLRGLQQQYQNDTVPVLIHQTFNGPKALGPPFEDKNHDCIRDKPRDEIWFTDPNRPYQTTLRIIQHAEDIFRDTQRSCTVFYNHNNTNAKTDPDIDRSCNRALIWCQQNYSIDLWSLSNSSDSSDRKDLTVDCYDSLITVEKAILETRSGEAYWRGKFDQPDDLIHGVYNDRYWITSSFWSNDQTWGVDLTWLENGCPQMTDKDYLEKMVTVTGVGKKPDRNHRAYSLVS